MRDKDLYAALLGATAPWRVREVKLRAEAQEVEVFIEHDGAQGLRCPQHGKTCAQHDKRWHSWRPLDTCEFRMPLTAEVPWVGCAGHGVLQREVPWAERGSRFTTMFECLAIDWLREASVSTVSRRLSVSRDEADGNQQPAVRRPESPYPPSAEILSLAPRRKVAYRQYKPPFRRSAVSPHRRRHLRSSVGLTRQSPLSGVTASESTPATGVLACFFP